MELDQGLEANELFQAQCHIYKHMYHYLESMSLKCAVQLGIPDIIHKHNKPMTLLELASALDIPPAKANCLQRVIRILVHSGFFTIAKVHDQEEVEEDGYVLTTSSRLLLKDSPTTLSPFALAMLNPALITPWFSLSEWYQGNQLTAFETYHGKDFWQYGKENQDFIKSLNEGMACDSQLVSLIVKDHKEIFEGVASLVDVGGGTGTLARAIADAYPLMTCAVLDLPQVVANLQETKNMKFVAGDMFHSIPSADAILIKSVLHNWSDEACIKILKRCREAIQSKDEGGKVIIIEVVINEKKDECEVVEKTKLFMDMEMMLICTGKERNEEEWARLFLEAGFNHYKITATSGLNSIIEVYP
ncbi:o-methyltransferase, putative [Ricinus communis]|uniref:O-methyltransferase, putative n=2 Tax=Ricinus communis TaxID=3988 RepID=B9S931_RICCO|nr:o-methyltransferase, putative [Ricinus communis]